MKNSKKLVIGGLVAVLIVAAVAVLGTKSGDELTGKLKLRTTAFSSRCGSMVPRFPGSDPDGDGMANWLEVGGANWSIVTDPCNPDTDNDGYDDGWELTASSPGSHDGGGPRSNPLDPCDPNPSAAACITQGASIERR